MYLHTNLWLSSNVYIFCLPTILLFASIFIFLIVWWCYQTVKQELITQWCTVCLCSTFCYLCCWFGPYRETSTLSSTWFHGVDCACWTENQPKSSKDLMQNSNNGRYIYILYNWECYTCHNIRIRGANDSLLILGDVIIVMAVTLWWCCQKCCKDPFLAQIFSQIVL